MNAVAKPISRARILAVEALLEKSPDHIDMPVRHIFAPGVYCREATIPAGMLAVGKIHKHSHVNVISAGRILVATEEGAVEYAAPMTFISLAGTKRIVQALEDTIWMTIHPTDKTDLDEIEQDVIADSYEDYDKLAAMLEEA